MSGNISGGIRAAETIKKKYGEDYYIQLGAKGGKTRTPGTKRKGFASNRQLASIAGRKGGQHQRNK